VVSVVKNLEAFPVDPAVLVAVLAPRNQKLTRGERRVFFIRTDRLMTRGQRAVPPLWWPNPCSHR